MSSPYPRLGISHAPDCDLPGRLEEIRRAEGLRSASEVVRWLAFDLWAPGGARVGSYRREDQEASDTAKSRQTGS